MANSETANLLTAEVDNLVRHGDDSDDDGLDDGSETAETYDELYLDVEQDAEEETAKVHAGELKILHGAGNSKLKRTFACPDLMKDWYDEDLTTQLVAEELLLRTMADDFNAAQALDMLQHRYTVDYGRRSSGSKPASQADEYYPTFHLDMISVVGQPLRPIVHRSSFFDNVDFTFRHWQARYSSKHAVSSLPFELTNRTFRLATGASRELWFVVMHPLRPEALELPTPRAAARSRGHLAGSRERSAMRRHHAEALAEYIKDLFLDGALIGEGVEPSWALGDRRSQNISFEKWSEFQALFMDKWPAFAQLHAYDQFWGDHQPAFHAYDHGANIKIEVTGALKDLPREARLRTDEDGSGSDSDNESSEGSEDEDEEGSLFVRERRSGSETAQNGERGISNDEEFPAPANQVDEANRELYTDGLEQLRVELEKKYNLEHIAQISYAIAADIHGLEGSSTDGDQSGDDAEQEPKEAICLLADRSRVAAQYSSAREATFYPLAFHPRYGNFTSKKPPHFLNDLYAVMRDNMSLENDGHDVLNFDGGFQGYNSGVKRTVRHRAEDLLARKGTATAALTLPPSEVSRSPAPVQAKNGRLLREIRGERTPGRPRSSTPFAREYERIRAAIAQEEIAFRMEQVVTVRVSRLVPSRRTFFNVLKPIFQIMRFFLKEPDKYTKILRRFPPSIFPGILCSFARLFEVAFGEMERRFRAKGAEGLDLALCESIAVLDRLGNYCFTGDPRVLPSTVLGPLVTMESIRKGAWPFISPEMLDFRGVGGSMNMGRWPRSKDKQNRPILLHVAALGYHYGALVAANRHSEMWFGQLSGKGIHDLRKAVRFLEELFREIWIPQTVAFVALQLRRKLNRGVRSGKSPEVHARQAEQMSTLLGSWEMDKEPFGKE